MKRLIDGFLYLVVFLLSVFFLEQALRPIVELFYMKGRSVSVIWYSMTYPTAAVISWWIGRQWVRRSALKRYFFCALMVALLAGVAVATGIFLLLQVANKMPEAHAYMTTHQGANLLAMLAVVGELLVVVAFVVVFSMMTGKKVRYINDISARVAHMDGLLPVKGEDEITELSRSINRMWTELQQKRREEQQQNERQTRMIGDISHDLRTPLTTIQGYIDLLERDRGAMSSADRQAYLGIVQRKLSDLNAQINQLFEYTKLSQADYPLNRQMMDVNGLLAHICSSYRLIFEQAGFNWHCSLPDKPVNMAIDPQKMGQAIENLMENARKYAVPSTDVYFESAAGLNEFRLMISNRVDAAIRDVLPHLFERFYRADQSRPTGGTGLGLPIVKKIVELHGGTIEATYDNGFLTLEIALPLIGQ